MKLLPTHHDLRHGVLSTPPGASPTPSRAHRHSKIVQNSPLRAAIASAFVDLIRSEGFPSDRRSAMGVSVAKSFDNEVARAFRFLVSEYGLSGPTGGGQSPVTYSGE